MKEVAVDVVREVAVWKRKIADEFPKASKVNVAAENTSSPDAEQWTPSTEMLLAYHSSWQYCWYSK
jgi:hypothetical protein